MHSARIASLLLVLISLSAQKQISQYLTYGDYHIGYKLFHLYDKNRSYFDKYDYFQQSTHAPVGRPMQISMWYPAKTRTGLTPLLLKDYIGFSASETDFSKQNISDQQAQIEATIQSIRPDYRERFREFLNQTLPVYLNAPIADGDFPLVLYSPPQDASAYDNQLICQYLASNGYLVLAVAAKGEYSRLQAASVRSIYTQADDLAFMLEFGRQHTDSKKVATFGFSRGGLANLIFAMKNKDIDATISLDGSIMSQGWLDDIASSSYYTPERFKSNLLIVTKNMADPKLNPSTFYDQVIYANKSLIRFDHGEHGYFSSYNLLFELLFNDQLSTNEKTSYYQFFAELTRYLGEFLDHYLKNESRFKAHDQQAYKHSFVSSSAAKQAIDPSSVSPLLIKQGYDYVKRILDDIRNYESDFIKNVSWRDLHYAASQAEQKNDEINILKLADQAFPNWYLTHFKLAELYREQDETGLAIQHYLLAIKDHPRHQASREALTKMAETFPDYHQQRLTNAQLEFYFGKYSVDEKRHRLIYLKDGKLWLESNYWERPLELWPISKTLFLVEDDNPRFNLQILFQFDQSGRVKSLKTRGLNSGRIGAANMKVE